MQQKQKERILQKIINSDWLKTQSLIGSCNLTLTNQNTVAMGARHLTNSKSKAERKLNHGES